METFQTTDRQGDMATAPRGLSCDVSTPRTIRGRDQHVMYENRFVEKNVNNNSKPIVSRDNSNNNNNNLAQASRRSDLEAMTSQSTGGASRLNFRSRPHEGDVKNGNIITIVNNSIEFEKNLRDADRADAFGNTSLSSNSSCSNASFQEGKDQEAELTQVKQGLEACHLTADNPEIAEPIPDPGVASQEEPALTQVDQEENALAFGCPKQNQVFQTLKGIQQLRKDGSYADLTVKVDEQTFRCHKLVLANSSPFFKNVIDGTTDASLLTTETNLENIDSLSNYKENDMNSNNSNNTSNSTSSNVNNNNSIQREDALKEKSLNNSKKHGFVAKQEANEKLENISKNDQIEATVHKEDRNTMSLKNINPGTFEKILDFAYCVFDDVLSADNALELLLAADRLQMTLLSQTCASYIAQTLSPGNVFDVIRLYDAGCAGLLDQRVLWKSHQVLRENFLDLVGTEEFLSLGSMHVRGLVEESMLHVPGEMQVLQGLLRWVKFKPEERSADMTLMLQHIRFPLMSPQELDKVLETCLLKENKLAKALVKESRFYSSMDYTSQMNWPRQNCISRRLFPTRDFILWTADRDKGLHFYSVIDGAHHKVTSFTNSRLATAGTPLVFDSTASVCCYDDKIYFSGGEFMTDKLWSVDSVTGQVTVLAQMPRGRKYHSMVATRGCIYCLGGQDKRGYTVLDCVDGYVISKDTWVKAGKLAEPAYNMAAVVCDRERRPSNSGGAIYLLGGEDHSGKPLRLIQCFEWLPPRLYSAFKVGVTGMPPSLFSARAITSGLDSLIYVVCGDGEVYKFEPDKSTISHVTTIKNLSDNPRQRFGLAHVGGRLIVLGGHQLGQAAQEPIRSVCLDIANKAEVKEFAPLLPGDNVNNCLAAKLSTNTLNLFL